MLGMDLSKLIKVIDGTETDARHKAIKLLINAGLSEDSARSFISYLNSELPNLKGSVRKFYVGIVRWVLEGTLDIEDKTQMSRLNTLLRVLSNHPAFDFYDKDFNGASFQEVLDMVQISDEVYHKPSNTSYTVVKIDSFSQAVKYKEYAPDWCILNSEIAFKEHTLNGANQFYFLLRSDYKEVPKSPGEEYPYDDYGYSMIAVCIGPDGNLESSTSRWNFDDYHDNFLDLNELGELGFLLVGPSSLIIARKGVSLPQESNKNEEQETADH